MTGNRKKAYRKALFSVGAGLLCVSAFAVAGGAVWGRNKLEKELDAKLERRVQKITQIGLYAAQDTLRDYRTFREETSGDVSNPVYTREPGDYVFEIASPDSLEADPDFQVLPAISSYFQDDVVIAEDGRMLDNLDYGGYLPVILDEDGDYIYYINGRFVITINGLYYGDVMILDGVSSSATETFGALNSYSEENTEVKAAAKEMVEKEQPNGWYKEYRYVNWVVLVGRPERSNTGVLLKSFRPGEEQDNNIHMSFTSDVAFESLNTLRYILFLDGSAFLYQWRMWTVYNSIVMLLLDAVIMAVLAILLRSPRGSKRDAPVTENAEESGVVKTGETVRAEEGLAHDPPEDTMCGETRSFGRKIPKDVARELLSYISQSEASLGPNGYLDQMRELIEKRQVKKKPGRK